MIQVGHFCLLILEKNFILITFLWRNNYNLYYITIYIICNKDIPILWKRALCASCFKYVYVWTSLGSLYFGDKIFFFFFWSENWQNGFFLNKIFLKKKAFSPQIRSASGSKYGLVFLAFFCTLWARWLVAERSFCTLDFTSRCLSSI